jgi:hypothetical protein
MTQNPSRSSLLRVEARSRRFWKVPRQGDYPRLADLGAERSGGGRDGLVEGGRDLGARATGREIVVRRADERRAVAEARRGVSSPPEPEVELVFGMRYGADVSVGDLFSNLGLAVSSAGSCS